jgi:integrase
MSKRANGDGSIHRRKDGRWCASIGVGKGKRKHFLSRDRDVVAKQLAAALKKQHDREPIVTDRQTVAQYLKSWLASVQPSLKHQTWRRYEQYVRLHIEPELGRLQLRKLTPQHVQRLYASKLAEGLSSTTVHHLHATLHKALSMAVRWDLVQRNVADLVDPPRSREFPITTLSPVQARALLAAARDNRLEALYVLALTTGMRQGELLALSWDDIDFGRAVAQVRGSLQRTPDGLQIAAPKTSGSRRSVALAREPLDALRRHKTAQAAERLRMGAAWEDHGLVFPNEVGRPMMAANMVRRSFEPLLRTAGLPPIRFHDLRHTAATLLLGEGVHPKVVSEMLGHTRISTTMDLYSHVTPTMQRQAVAAFDSLLRR